MVTEYLGFLLNKLNFRKSINIYNFSRFFSHNLKVNTKKPTYLHSKLETFLLPSALIKFLNSQICHQHTSYYFTQSHILTDAYTSHSLKSATLLTQFLKTQKSTTNPEYPQQANPKTSNHVTKVKKKKKKTCNAVIKTHQVIHDMRSRGVPPRITEPFTTRRHIAPHNTRWIGHPTIPASVFGKIPFTILVIVIIPSVLEIQPTHPRRQCIHHLAIPAAVAPGPPLRAAPGSRRNGRGIRLVIGPCPSPTAAALRRVGERIGGGGPRHRRPNRVAKLWVIEILTLSVEFEEGVGVVARVGLRSGLE